MEPLVCLQYILNYSRNHYLYLTTVITVYQLRLVLYCTKQQQNQKEQDSTPKPWQFSTFAWEVYIRTLVAQISFCNQRWEEYPAAALLRSPAGWTTLCKSPWSGGSSSPAVFLAGQRAFCLFYSRTISHPCPQTPATLQPYFLTSSLLGTVFPMPDQDPYQFVLPTDKSFKFTES